MNILIIFLAVILGVIVFLTLVFLILKNKFTKFLNSIGYASLNALKDELKNGGIESKTNHKHVTGMTKLLIPKVVKDFPNFSESELYTKVETSLLAIFNCLENKKIQDLEKLVLIKDKLKETIEDYRTNNIKVTYDDVKFHNHALKYYKKEEGALNISISTSLEYYYKKEQDKKIINDYTEYKKQTRYTTEFVYVYDPEKIVKNQNLIGINCPNCAAPVKDLGNKKCRYCGSGLEDINLKSWHISAYKEDY